MKNLLRKYTGILSLLSFLLILPVHYAHSQIVDELFGIKLFDNATNYVSSEYIENNKRKHLETISGFWTLYIGDKVSSPYFDKFFIYIDNHNIIHTIQGERKYPNEDRCQSFLYERVRKLENKKNINLSLEEQDYGNWKTTKYLTFDNDVYISIQCNFYFTSNESNMIYYIASRTLTDAIDKFYDQD